MLILHPYSLTRWEEQQETWDALRKIESANLGIIVKDVRCDGPQDYDKALKRVWGNHNLVICEQDIVPTLEMIQRLASCNEYVCAQAYRLPLAEYAYPIAHRDYDESGTPCYIGSSKGWADIIGLGLAHFDLMFQILNPDILDNLPPGDWQNLDIRLSKLISEKVTVNKWSRGLGPFHIHYPEVKHNHKG